MAIHSSSHQIGDQRQQQRHRQKYGSNVHSEIAAVEGLTNLFWANAVDIGDHRCERRLAGSPDLEDLRSWCTHVAHAVETSSAGAKGIAISNSQLLGDQRVLGEMVEILQVFQVEQEARFSGPVALGTGRSLPHDAGRSTVLTLLGLQVRRSTLRALLRDPS